MKNTRNFRQADLLLRLLPYVREEEFALKGGTAINYFYRELPRLSIDIDLTFLPLLDRETSLERISKALHRISERIKKWPGTRLNLKKSKQGFVGLTVEKNGMSIKIEPNLVFRGTVFPPGEKNLVKTASQLFETEISFMCLSPADLYGSKICAALDRQHPRDLFDIKLLLENEGLTNEVRQAFIIFLISHPRPMVELLNPNLQDLSLDFFSEFRGMTIFRVSLDELIHVRKKLVTMLKAGLTPEERRFILSVKSGKHEWNLCAIKHARNLPAVQWKLRNISQMEHRKHKRAREKLQKFLEL